MVQLPECVVPKAKTLLLDLDETLIHSCSQRENPQVTVTAYGDFGEEAKVGSGSKLDTLQRAAILYLVSAANEFVVHDLHLHGIVFGLCECDHQLFGPEEVMDYGNLVERKLHGDEEWVFHKGSPNSCQ